MHKSTHNTLIRARERARTPLRLAVRFGLFLHPNTPVCGRRYSEEKGGDPEMRNAQRKLLNHYCTINIHVKEYISTLVLHRVYTRA